ncbi:unnamed protein product [Kluyveromyces dobzhanskii CBS 2104]|uniref:WGS project CCBQ000000000 data, contig 00016 n=1 Tax=Kluyveromyces dobzhanskii CBS 2104 TaxID=1427455 RepID=A0A0A8KZM4_9SACH|nr:unnamed protein product [Kluyveromyces dobzhanskii CBS 2104]
MSALLKIVDFATNIVALWIPLVLTLSTVFEIHIIYKRTLKGYYETQEFRYQGEKIIKNEEELAKFQKVMHKILQKNVSLHRYGLKRLHLCEFWCIYWMLTFAVHEVIVPWLPALGVPKGLIKLVYFLLPFALYIYIHERPSHKSSEVNRPLRFPKLLAEMYIFKMLPAIKSTFNIMMPTLTIDEVHKTIKHVNTTIAASDFNMFESESKPIFYFEPYLENCKQPTTLSIANMTVGPESVRLSSRSSTISSISPAEALFIAEKTIEKKKPKAESKRKIVTRLNNLFRHEN